MANYSTLTRLEQVLVALQEAKGGWVDGPELANERVGGSEGLKRLRELRDDHGWDIRKRKHPDPRLDIYQYRLVPQLISPEAGGKILSNHVEEMVFDPPITVRNGDTISREETVTIDPDGMVTEREVGPWEITRAPEPAEKPDYGPPRREKTHLGRTESGQYVVIGQPPAEIEDELEDLPPPQLPGQMDMGVPVQEETYKFSSMPTALELGKTLPCPRCHGYRRPIRERDPVTNKQMKSGKILAYEDWCRDPHKPSQTCPGCNGFGVVPS